MTPIFLIIDLYSIDILKNNYHSEIFFEDSPTAFGEENIVTKDLNKLKIDTTSKTILLFGDSMVDGVREVFRKYCKYNNHKFYYYAWTSSTTSVWANSNKLKSLLDKYQPDYVFIMLGSNELLAKDLRKREDYITKIVEQLNGVNYVWIGPPNWKEDNGLNNTIEKVTGKENFFPSKNIFLVPPLKYKRSGDKKHPNFEGYKAWTDSIASWVMTNSKYPIKLEKPID
ncbi:MAG: SGNH/GDSL hydrolase family protein [Ignavibacteria bacterium]|nr:SGNH/GDSL hydrolase family protein [Ignavibacteria bacterium]